LGNLQDKKAKETTKEIIEDLKKAIRGEIELFFVDETILRLLSTLIKCWMKRESQKQSQKRIATPGQQKLHYLIGVYNWRTGELVCITCKKKNSEAFCKFLNYLMVSVTSNKPVVYVLDNTSYHHSKLSEAMIAYYEDRSFAFWQPPYLL